MCVSWQPALARCERSLVLSLPGVIKKAGWGLGLARGEWSLGGKLCTPPALTLSPCTFPGGRGERSRLTCIRAGASSGLSPFLVSPKPPPGNLGWSGRGGVGRGGAEPSWCRQGFVIWADAVSCLRCHSSQCGPCGLECKSLERSFGYK